MGIWPWQVPVLRDSQADRWLIMAKGDMGSRRNSLLSHRRALVCSGWQASGRRHRGLSACLETPPCYLFAHVALGHNGLRLSNDRAIHQLGVVSWTTDTLPAPGLVVFCGSKHPSYADFFNPTPETKPESPAVSNRPARAHTGKYLCCQQGLCLVGLCAAA